MKNTNKRVYIINPRTVDVINYVCTIQRAGSAYLYLNSRTRDVWAQSYARPKSARPYDLQIICLHLFKPNYGNEITLKDVLKICKVAEDKYDAENPRTEHEKSKEGLAAIWKAVLDEVWGTRLAKTLTSMIERLCVTLTNIQNKIRTK